MYEDIVKRQLELGNITQKQIDDKAAKKIVNNAEKSNKGIFTPAQIAWLDKYYKTI